MAEVETVTFEVSDAGDGHHVVSGDCAHAAIKLYAVAVFILEVLRAYGPSGDNKSRAVAEALEALKGQAESVRRILPHGTVN
jgi:hypothetical protein